jgi:VWFA-related protein
VTRSASAVVCLAAFTAVGQVAAQTALPATRALYLSALDDKGAPVTGLTVADLVVREDGKPREIVRVTAATSKLSIALLVDDGGVGLNDIRSGLAGFMNRLLNQAEFSVTGIAEQNRTYTDFTRDGDALGNAIRALQSRNVNGGGHLLEAVLEAVKSGKKKEAERPVILVVTNQANEYGHTPVETVMEQMTRTSTAIYVAEVLRRSGPSRPSAGSYDAMAAGAQENEASQADRARNKILGDGPRQTGGRRVELIATTDIPKTLLAIADDLKSQYVVVFASDAKPSVLSRVAVSTSKRGVKVRAATSVTDRPAR